VRVLLLNQFYPPDLAPTGRYLHDLARVLVARNHTVSVLASQASYGSRTRWPDRQASEGVSIERLPGPRHLSGLVGRAAGGLVFALRAAARARRTPHDLLLSLTTPPFIGWVAARVARRAGSTLVHWVMDVYPDVLVAHGLIAPGGFLDRRLRTRAGRDLAAAQLVVSLGSPQMRGRLAALGARELLDLPLWSLLPLGSTPAPLDLEARQRLGWRADELVLLYSGNLGRGHRLQEFLRAADRQGAQGPRFVFAGGGVRRKELERFKRSHPHARLECLPYADEDALRSRLTAADVHLVSLAATFEGLLVPSKLQAAFALGRPVLFVGPPGSETAAHVVAARAGWVVPEGDDQGVESAIAAARDPHERAQCGARALAYAAEHFDPRRGPLRLAVALEQAHARAAGR